MKKDNLNVALEIKFDADKMYQLLMQKLDGRSWNIEKLERTLNTTDLESFINFIKQQSALNTFSNETNLIRSYILDVFFRRYNEFIIHNIVVTSKNKNITKLSHGQQGTIYLRLKLAANLFSKTIIYDQPEDDLDNEFIMSDLVSIFRKIKKYRQVIIVSHNANLVVNADSEQIIIARNEDGILKYITGSLENPEINKQICKILEGSERAFYKPIITDSGEQALEIRQIATIKQLALNYSPQTIAMLGAILETLNQDEDITELFHALNHQTSYQLGISNDVLLNQKKWNIHWI